MKDESMRVFVSPIILTQLWGFYEVAISKAVTASNKPPGQMPVRDFASHRTVGRVSYPGAILTFWTSIWILLKWMGPKEGEFEKKRTRGKRGGVERRQIILETIIQGLWGKLWIIIRLEFNFLHKKELSIKCNQAYPGETFAAIPRHQSPEHMAFRSLLINAHL